MTGSARRIALEALELRRDARRVLRDLPRLVRRETRHRLRRDLPADPGPRADLVLVIGAARVGSNFVNDRLGHMDGNLAANELFLAAEAIGIRKLPELQDRLFGPGQRVETARDPRARRACGADPEAVLDHLRAVAAGRGCDTVSLKLFPNHQRPVDRRHLIATPPRLVLFLTRKRLDSYISGQKARQVGSFFQVDTTDVKPSAGLGGFHRFSRFRDKMLARMIRQVDRQGLPWARLDYDAVMARGPEAVDAALNAAWAAAGLPGRIPPDAPSPRARRQDRTRDSFDKIENGPAFRADLARTGLLDWALRSPAEDMRWPARGRIDIDPAAS